MNLNLTKEQWNMIISAVIAFVIAILGALGYNVVVVQPQLAALQAAQAGESYGAQRTLVLGPSYESLDVTKRFTTYGAATLASASVTSATITNLTATTITATNVISQAVGFDTTGNGTAAAPVYTFASDPDTGLYRVGTNDLGVSAGGTLRFDVSATAATAAVPLVLPVGSAAAPAATFTGDTDTGLYRVGANNLGIATNGALALDVGASTTTVAGALAANGGISVDTSAFTVSDTSGNVNTAGTLGIGGVTFSGPIKYGCAESVASGGTIAHGIATTPTVALVSGYGATITTTPYISALDTVSITVKFLAAEADAMTVCWSAGK